MREDFASFSFLALTVADLILLFSRSHLAPEIVRSPELCTA